MNKNLTKCLACVLFGGMVIQSLALEAMDDQNMQNIAGRGSILNGAPPKATQNKSALHKSMDQTNSQLATNSGQAANSQLAHDASVPTVQAQQSTATVATAENMLKGLAGVGGGSSSTPAASTSSDSSGSGTTVSSFVPLGAALNQAFGSGNNSNNPFANTAFAGVRGGSNVSVSLPGH